MKNQYFGDVNDYRKYGLLRALQQRGEGRLLVAWMLTPDDGGSDGGLRRYLEDPGRWRDFDPDLHDGLGRLLASGSPRSVALIEGTRLLPRTTFHGAIVPDGRDARAAWRRDLLASVARSGADLVFFDPDNGIEIPSKPVGRKDSSKYVAWGEVEEVWAKGCSVLVYQHFCREKRETFTRRIVRELRRRTGAPFTTAFRTAHVLFVLAAQPGHEAGLREAIARHLPTWKGQIDERLLPLDGAGGLRGDVEA